MHILISNITDCHMTSYHWALIIGPKNESKVTSRGTKYHVKNLPLGPSQNLWEYETRTIELGPVDMILIRLMIGKIKSKERVEAAMRSVPIRQDDPTFNCIFWVQQALAAIKADGKSMGTSRLAWPEVKGAAMKYVQEKKDQQRFTSGTSFVMSHVPTFDLLSGREVIP